MSDSEEDLLDPDLVFDRLLADQRFPAVSSLHGSINNPAARQIRVSPAPAAPPSGLETAAQSDSTRSSPRRKTNQLQAAPAAPDHDLQRHTDLANELFPPSPPAQLPDTRKKSIPGNVKLEPETKAPQSSATAARTEGYNYMCDLREDTVISDSEPEYDLNSINKTPSRKRRSKPRVSTSFNLDEDDSDYDRISSNQRVLDNSLAASLDLLGISTRVTDAMFPIEAAPTTQRRAHTATPAQATDPSRPRKYDAPVPALERHSHISQSKRRITISIVSSSSSSSSASEDEQDIPNRARKALPALTNTNVLQQTREYSKKQIPEEEVVIVETDDEDEPGGRNDLVSILPMLEPELRFNSHVVGDSPESRGQVGYKGMNDVWENDGVLIYDPTPRKRPTKLSMTPKPVPSLLKLSATPHRTTTPSSPATSIPARTGNKTPVRTKSRIDLDLTASSGSSEESDYMPPHPRTPSRKPPASPAATPRSTRTIKKPKESSKLDPPSSAPVAQSTLTASDRTTLPLNLIRQLDKLVFRKRWNGLKCLDRADEYRGEGLPEGLEVVWNSRLRNTAGRAKWKKTKTGDQTKHTTTIELATKVTDTEQKLKHTLAHELCHIASWILSGEIKPPHGNAFKLWAARIMQVRPDIEITTTHSYQIVYKYRWQCTGNSCGKIFGRHSNSINPATHGCPCGSKLVQLDKNGLPKKVTTVLQENANGDMVETPVKKKSPWLEYVATESPRIRKENPSIPQSQVMKVLSEQWKLAKLERDKQEDAGLEDAMRLLKF
ncbi:uncharacterized protein JCM15063_000163 [Sporobolomyces koalae]|uniref:uncharacterized protein n=1 Tax=Sporobolomyces koalae TaxID=500713 RepID=UPI00316BB3DB